MKIKMIESRPGAPFRTKVLNYQKGVEYETPAAISEDLANVFVGMNAAVELVPESVVPDSKALLPGDYENKAMGGPTHTKKEEPKGEKKERPQPMRVHELADHLEIHSKDVSKIAKKLKISASHSMSNLTTEEIERIASAHYTK